RHSLDCSPASPMLLRRLDIAVLRDAYAEIAPGYHMSKKHWITVAGRGDPGEQGETSEQGETESNFDADLLHDLVLESYCLVVAKLPVRDRPVDPMTFGGRNQD
ncbi:MmcQ/YjbR family DNA-binding protein, partial [Brevibacterium casei]|uniref:MmcQ/YjbR family DNA-binding protein n=1 Tax=Brevibacterium casei TaxID=33889 RepID=UPI003EE96419